MELLLIAVVVVASIAQRRRSARLQGELAEERLRLDAAHHRIEQLSRREAALARRLEAAEGGLLELRAQLIARDPTTATEAAPLASLTGDPSAVEAAPLTEAPPTEAPHTSTEPPAPALLLSGAEARASAPLEAAASPKLAAAAPGPMPAPTLDPGGDSAPAAPGFDWEGLIGVRLFSWIAGLALVLGAVFFLRYSVDQGWLGAPLRMAIGLLAGVGLLVGSELKGRRYRVTANALDAAGIAILFATCFAGHALWALVPPLPTFGLMILVTAVAVLLALRHDSLFIALLGLVGGFATPMLLSSGEDRPIGLFGYLLLLNVGLAWVAHRKRWPWLLAASVSFTALYQWGWIARFVIHNLAELPLAAGVFLLFPAVIVVAEALGRRPQTPAAGRAAGPIFAQIVTASAALPLLFALCLAWVPAFGQRFHLLFGWLLLLDLALFVLAITLGPALLHLASGLTTVLVFAGWIPAAYRPEAWPAALLWVASFVLFYAFAPFVARRLGRELGWPSRWVAAGHRLASLRLSAIATLPAALLLFVFPVLVFVEPLAAPPALPFALLFALVVIVTQVAVRTEAGVLYILVACSAVATEALWSAKHLTPERLYAALTIYTLFGLLYAGFPALARRLGKQLRPAGSGVAPLLASLPLLLFLAGRRLPAAALGGLALLLLVLNLGLIVEGRRRPKLALTVLAGALLSWAVLGFWWSMAPIASLLWPALVVVGGFALLVVGSNLGAAPQLAEGAALPSRQGVLLGLVGHVFICHVASQPALALPPWPLLGVLGVLDLAIVAAALWIGRGQLYAAALGASQLILVVLIETLRATPSEALPALVATTLSAIALAALGLAVLPLARRRPGADPWFHRGAAAGLYGAQLVLAFAAAARETPSWPYFALLSALPLLGFAWLVRRGGTHALAFGALAAAALGTWAWTGAHFDPAAWWQPVGLAAAPYLLLSAYPLLFRPQSAPYRSAPYRSAPYWVAVLGALPFFLFAREAILRGGHGAVIGVLPLSQALLLGGLLLRLLRDKAATAEDRGPVALTAGAALAFITVAIPLQLANEWITLGWALEAAALAWLYLRLRHRGLLRASFGLAAAVVVRLTLNHAVLAYHARSATPLLNFYLYTYLVAAAALFTASVWLRRTEDRIFPRWPRASDLQAAGATLLLFLLINIEIADFYATGTQITFNFSASLAQDLTYTLAWALFAIGLLVAGIAYRRRVPRIAALILLVITVAKCFLHDLWRLGGLFRVGSFVGLAICLALVAIALQKFVLARPKAGE
ncbi:MAG: DUF2339 domain-containing protein [Proteobacteria bacterium]|nr:DUF2339 domain-containing protein [Pseudomonadota bacterium]